jgi:ubiquinone/menaquinone biosynthesis C-methylase UbiE
VTAWVGSEEGYRRWAPTYDQTLNPLLSREERHITPLLPSLAQSRVLDLACGTGRWLQEFLARGAPLAVGVDCSPAMLRVANAKPAIRGQLARADCLQLPFGESVFDLAICSFALSHIADLRGVAAELARLMKPNSDVFVTDLHSEAYTRGWRTRFRDEQNVLEIETLPRTVEEIAHTFQAEGFECLMQTALHFDEPEKPIFEQARKGHAFEDARRTPAILFCHFRLARTETSREQG